MKKLSKISLKTLENKLSEGEMKNVVGAALPFQEATEGEPTVEKCSVRCDQSKEDGKDVPNCSRATVEGVCGSNLSNTVCVCTR